MRKRDKKKKLRKMQAKGPAKTPRVIQPSSSPQGDGDPRDHEAEDDTIGYDDPRGEDDFDY